LLARVLTALFWIPIFLVLLCMGGWAWFALLAVLSVLAGFEMGRFYERLGCHGTGLSIAVGGLTLLIAAYASLHVTWSWPLAIALITIVALVGELSVSGGRVLQRGAAICMGSLYVGLFAFLFLVRADGLAPVLLAVLGTWCADSFAFFVGRAYGRTAFAPTISPNKTVEGALAGVFGGLVAGIGLGLAVQWPLWYAAVLGMTVALAAEIGDLVESAMKREAGVKDAGSLLPGHGGILDRFDSMLLAGVAVYLLRLLLR
jgi:phosphatidate cytidylyltransferase